MEEVDGIRFVRSGLQWTVHWTAFRHYYGKLAQQFDVVIDQVNTIPFFTPLWADIPVVMLIHQLAREVWWYESRFPISAIGFLAEPWYLRSYRDVAVLTVSTSTKEDLRRIGLKGAITVIPEGIEPIEDVLAPKATEVTFLYVGRFAPSKRIEQILDAFARFRQSTSSGRLLLVGTGSEKYERSLINLAGRLKIERYVSFLGRVSTAEKHRLMHQAHALLMASVREGWGLVVTEANACGTPAIVYDVPGLHDSVRHESTGLVVAARPLDLADAMVRIISDPVLYARLSTEGRRWSSTFSFDTTARIVEREIVEASLAGRSAASNRTLGD